MKKYLYSALLIAATLTQPAFAGGDQTSGQDLQLGSEQVANVMVGRDVNLDGTTVNGNVMAGREVNAQQCHIAGSISGGSNVQAEHCASIGSIHAGRDLVLLHSHVEDQVNVGRNLRLTEAAVDGDATVGADADLNHAGIRGTLTIASPYLALHESTIGNIHVEEGNGSINVMGNGSSVIVNNNHNQSVIHVGDNATSSINGFTVRSGNGQTTVITPDNTIYVNGSKVSGNGPASYSDYQGAPWVEGPGWAASTSSSSTAPQQVVELMAGSTVTNITFDSGHGKVLLHSGAKILGSVQGGVTENL